MDARLYSARRRRNWFSTVASLTATLIGLAWLAIILGVLVWHGVSGLSLRVFTEMTPPPGASGGLLNAIVGSLIMTALATAIGAPIGVLAGTYMAEYGRYDKLKNSADKTKARAYFQQKHGAPLPPPKVIIELDKLLRRFILEEGFDLE
jgi:ABC-type phosphate transport system permease subunit